jgi:hypothetical protein
MIMYFNGFPSSPADQWIEVDFLIDRISNWVPLIYADQ